MPTERPRLVIRDLGDSVDIGGVILQKNTFDVSTEPEMEFPPEPEKPQKLLNVFLSHSSDDKRAVRELYQRFCEDNVDAWLDEKKLLPGENWRDSITKAMRDSDVFLACFSRRAVTKEGFVQKELREALEIAKEKPVGAIFIIPIKVDPIV